MWQTKWIMRSGKKFRQTCDDAKEDFYILGEIWHSSQKLAPRRRISCSDELCIHRCDYGLLCQSKNCPWKKMLSEMNNQLMLYRQQTNQMQFNVLDSHDTPRLLHETKRG